MSVRLCRPCQALWSFPISCYLPVTPPPQAIFAVANTTHSQTMSQFCRITVNKSTFYTQKSAMSPLQNKFSTSCTHFERDCKDLNFFLSNRNFSAKGTQCYTASRRRCGLLAVCYCSTRCQGRDWSVPSRILFVKRKGTQNKKVLCTRVCPLFWSW